MSDPFIIIQNDGFRLKSSRGFLEIIPFKEPRDSKRYPWDQIEGILVEARGVTFSRSALVEASIRGIPLVLCDENHLPITNLLPFSAHHRCGNLLELQSSMRVPVCKTIWKDIVIAKIRNQHKVLVESGAKSRLLSYANRVKSNDADNREAAAARMYWKNLYGQDFGRDQDAGGINAMLNFGYTLVRTAFAKEIVLHGLNPAFGVHHSNDRNCFRLADDLIEPFRPAIDYVVHLLALSGSDDVSSRVRQSLHNAVYGHIFSNQGFGRSMAMGIRATVRGFRSKVEGLSARFDPFPGRLMERLFDLGQQGALTE